jgi:hypothetical protein
MAPESRERQSDMKLRAWFGTQIAPRLRAEIARGRRELVEELWQSIVQDGSRSPEGPPEQGSR